LAFATSRKPQTNMMNMPRTLPTCSRGGTTVGELSSYLLEIEQQDALGLRGDSTHAEDVAAKLLTLVRS